MKKIMLVMITAFILLAGCGLFGPKQADKLEKVFAKATKDDNQTELQVQEQTNFEWDKAYLFTPYSTEDGMSDELGFSFKDPSNIDMRDDIYLLVFVQNDTVIRYAELKRNGADYSIGDQAYLTPTESTIYIERYE